MLPAQVTSPSQPPHPLGKRWARTGGAEHRPHSPHPPPQRQCPGQSQEQPAQGGPPHPQQRKCPRLLQGRSPGRAGRRGGRGHGSGRPPVTFRTYPHLTRGESPRTIRVKRCCGRHTGQCLSVPSPRSPPPLGPYRWPCPSRARPVETQETRGWWVNWGPISSRLCRGCRLPTQPWALSLPTPQSLGWGWRELPWWEPRSPAQPRPVGLPAQPCQWPHLFSPWQVVPHGLTLSLLLLLTLSVVPPVLTLSLLPPVHTLSLAPPGLTLSPVPPGHTLSTAPPVLTLSLSHLVSPGHYSHLVSPGHYSHLVTPCH